MRYPEFIKECQTIHLTAPSLAMTGKWYGKRGKQAKKEMKKLGFKVIQTKSTTKPFRSVFENTSYIDKANELLEAYKDKSSSIVWSVAGGETMIKTIELLDFNQIKKLPPKWFIGMSDNTNFGLLLPTLCDVASIYSYNFPSMGALPYHKSQDDLIRILKGEDIIQYSFQKYSTSKPLKALSNFVCDKRTSWKSLNKQDIKLEGRFIGGCLDVIIALLGTKFDNLDNFCKKYQEDGIVLFLESCDLNILGQIRAYDQLINTSWFKYVKGLVIGRPLHREKVFNVKYEEMLHEEFDKLNIPVIYDFDIGHTSPMLTMINGGYAELTLRKKKGTIHFKLI